MKAKHEPHAAHHAAQKRGQRHPPPVGHEIEVFVQPHALQRVRQILDFAKQPVVGHSRHPRLPVSPNRAESCGREKLPRQRRANEVVGWRMDFSSDANANFEGLLEVNREICMPQMAEKTSPDAPPNCAVLP